MSRIGQLVFLSACVLLGCIALGNMQVFGSQSDEPVPPAQESTTAKAPTPAAGPCVLKGRVPVVPPRKQRSGRGHYGINTTSKIGQPDPPVSVVWVETTSEPLDPETVPTMRIEQEEFQFRPSVTVVQSGTPVSFPNLDAMYHNVFSYSKAKRFDAGRYLPGEEPDAIIFDTPGTVSLHCEIHKHMRGHLVVVDSPYFTKTDAEGRFELKGLPAGTYVVHIWTGPKTVLTKEVELVEGKPLEVDWTQETDK